MKPWRRKTLVSLALVRCCHFHSNRGGAATDVNTRVIYSTRNTFRLTSLFPAQRTKGRVWGGEAGKRSVWGGAAPNVTCPQRAIGPVEEEYGVRAQPRQRLVRRGPGVLEEPLLAVVIEQRLRKKGRGSPVPTLRPGTAAGTPRPPSRPSPAGRTPARHPRPPPSLPPSQPLPPSAGEGRPWRPPAAPQRPSSLPNATAGGLRKAEDSAVPLAWEGRRREGHGKESCRRAAGRDPRGEPEGAAWRDPALWRPLPAGRRRYLGSARVRDAERELWEWLYFLAFLGPTYR